MTTKLTLPWPPSVNHYWVRTRHGGVRVSDRGIAFRRNVQAAVLSQCRPLNAITGRLLVDIVARQPDRRRRDLDNLLKSTLDALEHASVYGDDSQIDDLRIRWGEDLKGSGALVVRLRKL